MKRACKATLAGTLLLTVLLTAGAGQAAPDRDASTLYIHPNSFYELILQGISRADIMNGLKLEHETGVPLDTWMAAIQTGQSWADALQSVEASLRPVGRPPTDDEVTALLLHGDYSTADIDQILRSISWISRW